ncbi:hypothetical protein JTB14_024014 [Gonioctena quinquepunctata]|nr:hypothetical protein JTB14_024014 [Gonioctena quinquepunctata]
MNKFFLNIVNNVRYTFQLVTRAAAVERLKGKDHMPVGGQGKEEPTRIIAAKEARECTPPTREATRTHGVDQGSAQIDEATETFLFNIRRARDKITGSSQKRRQNIQELVTLKHRMRRDWQRTRYPALREDLLRLGREVVSLINDYKNEKWRNTLERFNPQDGSLWKMTKMIKKKYFNIPTILSGSEEAMTDRQKVRMLLEYFRDVHSLTDYQEESDRMVRELRARPKAVINSDLLAKLVTNHSETYSIMARRPLTQNELEKIVQDLFEEPEQVDESYFSSSDSEFSKNTSDESEGEEDFFR